jgi:hypothetical protein
MRGLVILAALCTSSTAQQGDFRPPTATEVFNLRSKCAQLGEKIMEDQIIRPAYSVSQVSRYDPRTNRCYVEIDVQGLTKGPQDYLNRYLYDGQTKEMLAYTSTDKGKRSGDVLDRQHAFDNGWDNATLYIDQKPKDG